MEIKYDRHAIRQSVRQFSIEDLEDIVFDSVAPAICSGCGECVDDLEPDADYVSDDHTFSCYNCGPGTRIASVLRWVGLI